MKGYKQGIQARVLTVALAPVIVTAIALVLYFTLLRYNDVESELRQRGFAMARQLAASAQYGLFSGNAAELNRLAQMLSHEPDVHAITIYDQRDIPLAASGAPQASPLPSGLKDGWNSDGAEGKILAFHNKVFTSSLPLDDVYAEKNTASFSQPLLLGSITIELSRDNLVARKREILYFTMAAALFILFTAGLIARRLGGDISEPILALETTVNKIREGVLDSRVQPHPAGTLRSLEQGINTMAAALELAHKRSTEALSSSNKQLQQQSDFANALLEAQSKAAICLLITDNGKIVLANQAAQDLAGLSEEALDQITISQLVAQEDRGKFERRYLNVLQGVAPYSRIEMKIGFKEGGRRWAEIVIFGIQRDNHRLVALLGIDVTQRKIDAQQLLKVNEQLQAQKEEAERANAAKSRFLAAASHDLRQPLHAITLFSSQLREQTTTSAQSRLAEQIDAAIGNMSELLGSLLDISKIDLATIHPEIRTIELGQLFAQVAASYQLAAENKQLRLRVARTSLRVSSDPNLLFRIVSNLVSNAVRYTERGALLIGARPVGDRVRIEIWDTGIGIEDKHIPHLFQEFYQISNPERDAGKGLGLGLAIVDRLACILGHKISLRSTPGAGSVFTVLLPRAAPENAGSNDSSSPKSSASIVIACDDEPQKNELAQMLKRWGYTVVTCQVAQLTQILDTVLPDLIVHEKACRNCPGQAGPLPKVIPVICLMEEAEITSAGDIPSGCSTLSTPVKPAKLRALILHLLAQQED